MSKVLKIAFMGNFSPEKGSLVFLKLVSLSLSSKHAFEWWIFGGIGDEDSYYAIKKIANLRCVGFFEEEELDGLVTNAQIDLGLILSPVPETYGKLSRQCWKLKLPLIVNQIGVFSDWDWSQFFIPFLHNQPHKALELLELVDDDRSLISQEKNRICEVVDKHQLLSRNNKHNLYEKIYQ